MSRRYARPGFVYIFKNAETGLHKIGQSGTPAHRVETLSERAGVPLVLVHLIASDDAPSLEECLHDHMGLRRVRGEWFDLPPEDLERLRSCGTHEDVDRVFGRTMLRKLFIYGTVDLQRRVRQHARRLRMTPSAFARHALARFLDLLESEAA